MSKARFTLSVEYDADSKEDLGGVARALRAIVAEQDGVTQVSVTIEEEW